MRKLIFWALLAVIFPILFGLNLLCELVEIINKPVSKSLYRLERWAYSTEIEDELENKRESFLNR